MQHRAGLPLAIPATFNQHALQFTKIGCRQRLVRPQLVDRNMIKVCAQEYLRLGAKAGEIHAIAQAGERNTDLIAHHIFKVGINRLPLLLVD